MPEILDGRVKTLHPAVHAGILARDLPDHQEQLRQHGFKAIDVVVANLYPFRATIADPQHRREDAIEQRSEEHTSELQSRGHLVCRLLLEKKKDNNIASDR